MTQQAGRGWLVVTIDTEEEGLWSGDYSAKATVENIAAIPRFQTLCDRFRIRPTYLVTTPVAETPAAIRTLRSIQDEGRCEIGAHVHPWNSPPIIDANSSRQDSFLCNLTSDVQYAKIEQLTDQIEASFGCRPISFRAGRYGIGPQAMQSLRDLGYRVDSSVLPRSDYRNQNGPDFRLATCQPYFPSVDDVLAGGSDDALLEIPVTAGFTHRHFELADWLRCWALRRPWRNLRAVGLLDRTGIAAKVKLSPEQATISRMKQLAAAVVRRGIPVLVLMFHSSSLLPGCSPYVKTEQDLNLFLERLEVFFTFACNELLLDSVPLGECYQHANRLISSGPLPATSILEGLRHAGSRHST